MRKTLLLIVAMLSAFSTVEAQNTKDSVKVFFDFGALFVHTDFMGNKAQLEDGIRRINEAQHDGKVISRVTITASASPEGDENLNKAIAERRAKSLAEYLAPKIGIDADQMVIDNRRVDWAEMLRLATLDPKLKNDSHLINYLTDVVQQQQDGKTVSDIQVRRDLRNKMRNFQYIRRHLYPKMRYAKAQVEMVPASQAATSGKTQPNDSTATEGFRLSGTPADSAITALGGYYNADSTVFYPAERVVSERIVSVREYYVYPDGTRVPVDEAETYEKQVQRGATLEQETVAAEPKARKNYYWALKTNLLFDALLVPNISAEWAFAPHWSVSGEYMHAWWKSDMSHKYWRTYGGNAELRYWFGKKAARKRLTGHHVGAYAGAFTYDFEWGGKGYLSRHLTTNFGLSYGYSAPIAKRLNIDFELGVGYVSGKYEEYAPKNGYYFWQSTKQRKFVGPTRAEVSLVWLLGHGNVNKK